MENNSGLAMGGNRELIEQVKTALQQGTTPEQLIQEGIPETIIKMAIQELQQMMMQQQGQQQMPMAM